jgi:hypothetical protein
VVLGLVSVREVLEVVGLVVCLVVVAAVEQDLLMLVDKVQPLIEL